MNGDLSDDDVDLLNSATKKKIDISTRHTLMEGDCLEKMNELEPQSIDCIINDPPYECTSNKWDKVLDLEKMWECYLRVLKPNGTVIMFACSDTTDDPLLPRLMMSRPKGWKFYTLVFQKANHSNPMLKDIRPLRVHEDIIVFYRGTHTYNPQMWEKTHRHQGNIKNQGNKEKALRCPISILPVFPREMNSANPTAKPVGTMEWLVKTYTDEYDTVLDNTMGSGTTGVACANTHRNFIGIEIGDEMFKYAHHRIDKAYKKTLRESLETDENATEPLSIELPERKPKFDVQDYTKFYEKVSQLEDHDVVVSWLVKYINQYFCIVADPHQIIEFVYGELEPLDIPCTPVMEEEMQMTNRALQMVSRKPAEVKLRFRKCVFYGENGKKADLYDAWSRSLENREYSSKVFDPTMGVAYDDQDILNTFVGLKAEQEVLFDQNNNSFQVNVEDFDIILYHIKNLCGGNIMYYEYLLDWLAFPIQNGMKTNVAVISYGGQGCGKSIIFEELMGEHIYGKQLYASISGGEQIGGSFNSHITGNMFLNIAEPNDFSKAKLNKLKDLITSSTAEVNSKGKDQVFVDDFTNYVFTCNTIPEDMLEEDDRRYFIIQHNGEKVGDAQFYTDLAFCVETQAHEFYKFLKMREIKHFVYGKKPPQTEVKKRLITMNIDPVFKYLQHLAEADTISMYYKRPSDGVPVLPAKAFFDNAVAWCEKNGEDPSWKRKQKEFRELLKSKLGDDVACFEPVNITMTDQMTGGWRSDRCVLFPKTADALTDLLVKKKVYTSFETDEVDDGTETGYATGEEEPELKSYEEVLAEEGEKAEVVELENMKKRLAELENEDKFDQE